MPYTNNSLSNRYCVHLKHLIRISIIFHQHEIIISELYYAILNKRYSDIDIYRYLRQTHLNSVSIIHQSHKRATKDSIQINEISDANHTIQYHHMKVTDLTIFPQNVPQIKI